MPNAPIHLPTKKQLPKKLKQHRSLFDKVVIVVSVLYPASALPQALTVFSGKIDGVAALSWMGFLVCSILFLIYGIRHRVAPMIISNSVWALMDSLVLIGLFTAGKAITWL